MNFLPKKKKENEKESIGIFMNFKQNFKLFSSFSLEIEVFFVSTSSIELKKGERLTKEGWTLRTDRIGIDLLPLLKMQTQFENDYAFSFLEIGSNGVSYGNRLIIKLLEGCELWCLLINLNVS